jgi:hypothetical protein
MLMREASQLFMPNRENLAWGRAAAAGATDDPPLVDSLSRITGDYEPLSAIAGEAA